MRERKFPYYFFILPTQWHEFRSPKLTNFNIFIIPLPLNVKLFSKCPYLTPRIKINYEEGCTEYPITTAKIEFFVALVSSFQPLINFTKYPNIGAMRVLDVPLEYYNVF